MTRNLVRKIAVSLTVISGVLLSTSSSLVSYAALPDEATYNFALSRYNLLVEDDLDCSYYANPNTLSINGNERSLLVLFTRSDPGGTICDGVFEFQVLRVKCNTGELLYSAQIASPSNWEEERHVNRQAANQICSLSR